MKASNTGWAFTSPARSGLVKDSPVPVRARHQRVDHAGEIGSR
jgi:hypothetical protein